MDSTKAFSVDNGLIVDEENGGPFYTGGTASPVGQGLPANCVYSQTVAGGVILWQKYGAGDTSADWRNYPAAGISYTPSASAYRSTSDNVNSALDELRELKLYVPIDTATTLNGTLTLTATSNTLNIISGTLTGYSVQLPDATTVNHGSSYLIVNSSTNPITIKDGAGGSLLTLNSEDVVECILEDDPNAAGTWLTIVTSGSATGVASYVVTSNTLFSTSSSTDVIITGFTTTPVPGRYSLYFSSDVVISQNNRISQCVTFVDGVAVPNTRRTAQGVSSNFDATLATIGEVTVNGAQAVDIRVNVSSGSLDVNQRSLILIRLGS